MDDLGQTWRANQDEGLLPEKGDKLYDNKEIVILLFYRAS